MHIYIYVYIIYIYIYIYTEGGTNHLGFQSHLLPLNINTPRIMKTNEKSKIKENLNCLKYFFCSEAPKDYFFGFAVDLRTFFA